MSIKDLDYQAKFITPTQQLYAQLNEQANVLFTQAKESIIEFHTQMADIGLEIYEHPLQTTTQWQTETMGTINQWYATFNDNILPAAKADYDKVIVTFTDYSLQSYQLFQIFLDNPQQITVEAFSQFNESFSTYINNTFDVSSIILNNLSNKADNVISLLIEQPMETMADFYYKLLTNLLNGYFDIISSILTSI